MFSKIVWINAGCPNEKYRKELQDAFDAAHDKDPAKTAANVKRILEITHTYCLERDMVTRKACTQIFEWPNGLKWPEKDRPPDR